MAAKSRRVGSREGQGGDGSPPRRSEGARRRWKGAWARRLGGRSRGRGASAQGRGRRGARSERGGGGCRWNGEYTGGLRRWTHAREPRGDAPPGSIGGAGQRRPSKRPTDRTARTAASKDGVSPSIVMDEHQSLSRRALAAFQESQGLRERNSPRGARPLSWRRRGRRRLALGGNRDESILPKARAAQGVPHRHRGEPPVGVAEGNKEGGLRPGLAPKRSIDRSQSVRSQEGVT